MEFDWSQFRKFIKESDSEKLQCLLDGYQAIEQEHRRVYEYAQKTADRALTLTVNTSKKVDIILEEIKSRD